MCAKQAHILLHIYDKTMLQSFVRCVKYTLVNSTIIQLWSQNSHQQYLSDSVNKVGTFNKQCSGSSTSCPQIHFAESIDGETSNLKTICP